MSLCKQCGAPHGPDARFCAQCGAALESVAETPVEATTEPQTTPEASPETVTPAPTSEPQAPVSLEKKEAAPAAEEPYDLVENGWPEAWPAEAPPPPEDFDLVRDGWPKPWADEPVPAASPDGTAALKKPLSFKITVAVLALLGLVAVGSVLAVLVTLFSSGGKTAWSTPIIQSLVHTQAAIADEFTQASEEIGLAPIMNTLAQKGETYDMTVSLPIEGMGTISLHAFQAVNAAQDSTYTTIDMNLMGFTMNLLEGYYENEYLAVASPFLFSGVYGFSLADMEDNFEESDLGLLMAAEDEALVEMVTNYFSSNLDIMRQATSNESIFSESTNKEMTKAMLELEKSMICADPVETQVLVNGDELTCEQLVGTIPSEAVKTYFDSYMETLLEDDFTEAYLRAVFATDPYYGEEMLDEMLLDLEKAINEFCTELEEVELTVYLQDGIALRTELHLESKSNESATIVLELGGKNLNLTDAITLTVYENEQELFSLVHYGSLIPKNGIVESDLTIYVYDSYMEEYFIPFEGTFYWDTQQTKDNFWAYFGIENEEFYLDIYGSIKLEDGIFIDPLEFFVFSEYDGEFVIDASMNVTPTTEVKSLEQNATDILKMSEEELYELYDEIRSSIYRFSGI